MKRGIIYFFISMSLGVWLVEMFTGWFDQTFLQQFIRGAWGWIYDFYRLSDGDGMAERRIS